MEKRQATGDGTAGDRKITRIGDKTTTRTTGDDKNIMFVK